MVRMKVLAKKSIVANIDNKSRSSNRYFGYDIFKSSADFFQKSKNFSIDPSYLISPGDEIIIMLWGDTEKYDTYNVSKDGYLFIPEVGQVFVNGHTLEMLEKKLYKNFKKVYSSLGTSNNSVASTFFDISIGGQSIKPLRLFILGEIAQPGAYEVSPSTTLFSSLFYSNGPTKKGSLREIKLIRNEKDVSTIDYYDYLLYGKRLKDVQIQRDDVVFIKPRGKTVSILGEITRPAIYELKEDEGLIEAIKIAGGVTRKTYMKNIQIERILPPSKRVLMGIDRTIIDINLFDYLDENRNHELLDGDVIKFSQISTTVHNVVRISSGNSSIPAIARPGAYQITPNMTLKDLIFKAGGLLPDVYLDRADIIRTKSDGTLKNIFINLSLVLSDDPDHNIKLKSGDMLKIYSTSSMLYRTDLKISGHVTNPGVKQYKAGMTLKDLIWEGGGFKNDEHLKNTYFHRAELSRFNKLDFSSELITFRLDSVLNGEGKADLKLKMGDEVTIYSIQQITGENYGTVTINGKVKSPGNYVFHDQMTVADLLFMAGVSEDSLFQKDIFKGRVDIIRNVGNDLPKIISFNLSEILNKDIASSKNNQILEKGDLVRVYSNDLFEMQQYVTVEGDINDPGVYQLVKNMTLADLVLFGGGIKDAIYNYRAEIASINPKNDDIEKYATIKTYDLVNDSSAYTENAYEIKSNEIYLKSFDLVTIRKSPGFSAHKKVFVEGMVNYPGSYVIQGPNEKVSDIISRAGGLKPEAYLKASKFMRNGKVVNISLEKMVKNSRTKQNFSVEENDKIIIGSKSNIVSVQGEVFMPGDFQYVTGSNLQDYLKIAGGLTKKASRREIILKHIDGKSKLVTKYSRSKIYDGSIIVVSSKEQVEPFSITQYVTNITSIWADAIQSYAMISILLSGSSGN